MKLLNLTGRFYALSFALITILSGFLAFSILKNHINNQFNQQLLREKEQLIYELENYEDIREIYYLNIGDRIELTSTESENTTESGGVTDTHPEPILRDTTMYDPYASDILNFRQYIFFTRVDGQSYRVTISKSLLSTEKLIEGIGEIMLITLVGLLLALLLVNLYLSKTIWGPFYKILEVLRSFDIAKPFESTRSDSRVDEFVELNEAINDILARNKKDYLNLKEFTENASHEIQTPLAIIKSKSELLIQSSTIKQEDLSEIKNIYDSVQRLSKLSKSLTLLSKIENNQFLASSVVDISLLMDEILESFQEIIDMRKIQLTKNFISNPKLVMNQDLAFILFSNLTKNSIKHNFEGGEISISINENEVIFANTGPQLKGDPKDMFQRFKKDNPSASPGLGLALVKQICDTYNLEITYSNSGRLHKFQLAI